MSDFPFPRLFAGSRPKSVSRLYMGLYINSEQSTMEGVIVRQMDSCISSAPEVLAVETVAIPVDLVVQYRYCQESVASSIGTVTGTAVGACVSSAAGPVAGSSQPGWFFGNAMVKLRAESTELLIQLAEHLLEQSNLSACDIIAAGILEVGFWFNLDGRNEYVDCIDPVVFASATGLNTISSFPRSDLAVSGLGGAITAVPFWILLRSDQKNRLVLELDNDAIRISYLAPVFRGGLKSVLSFDASPGLALLNHMVKRLSGNSQSCDQGGQLAVQGRKIPQLLSHWNENPFFQKPLPRWSPFGVKSTSFIIDAMNLAVESNWTVQDVLCTSVHFIADSIAMEIQKNIPGRTDELYMVGMGKNNGMLRREIARRVPNIDRVLESPEIMEERKLYAASAAILATLFVEQQPGNLPQVTGCLKPVLLGQLTPGAEMCFRTLLDVMNKSETQQFRIRAVS